MNSQERKNLLSKRLADKLNKLQRIKFPGTPFNYCSAGQENRKLYATNEPRSERPNIDRSAIAGNTLRHLPAT